MGLYHIDADETGGSPPARRLPALRDLFDRSIGMEIAAESAGVGAAVVDADAATLSA